MKKSYMNSRIVALSHKLKQTLAVALYTKANAFTMQGKTRAANLALGKVEKLGYKVKA